MRFNIIFLLILFFLSSCDEDLEKNPFDPVNNPDYIPPETIFTMEILEGAILDTSTITISWAGSNDLVTEYKHKLIKNYQLYEEDWDNWTPCDELTVEECAEVEYCENASGECSFKGDWSDWSTDTSITLTYLDEGDYTFQVVGRYGVNLDQDETPAIINFSVDMVQGPGIRVYPLLNEIESDDLIDVDIYAEEVEGLVIVTFQLQYDPIHLMANTQAIVLGEFMSDIEDYMFIVEQIDSGLIEINFTLLSHGGVSGTGPLFSIPFYSMQSIGGSSVIEILNPKFGDINGNQIPGVDSANGMIIIE